MFKTTIETAVKCELKRTIKGQISVTVYKDRLITEITNRDGVTIHIEIPNIYNKALNGTTSTDLARMAYDKYYDKLFSRYFFRSSEKISHS